MITRLKRFGRKIQWAFSMAVIDARADLQNMIALAVRFSKTLQRIANRDPREARRLVSSALQLFHTRAVLFENRPVAPL